MSTSRQDQINGDLQTFQNNPIEFMNQLPPKYDRQGNEQVIGTTLFDQTAIDNKKYVDAGDELRGKLTDIHPTRAAFEGNDRAQDLVDIYRYSGLKIMETNGLMESKLDESPWSDDYWAIYLGVLGKRYADPNFPASQDWKQNFDYVQANPAQAILASGNAAAINLLSPSEKYDALVGDVNQSLTTQMWNEGRYYYESYGKVETWMGICHGWAAAAYMLPRPTGTATVVAANGTPLTFYPSDIKALASLLWAKINTSTRFIGGRCNDKNPSSDPNTGRLLSNKCFDTNPGSWHLSVVNQVGVSRRSMVLDVTYDYEVWNQPILDYNYTYFNPKTRIATNSLAEATVLKSNFNNDLFSQYRSQAADSVVGIAMDIAYMVETSPTHNPSDNASNDGVKMVRYLYDLELDMVGNIIGGEWYKNAHPDFLWTPAKGSTALVPSTPLPGSWKSNQPVPVQWRELAAQIATSKAAPLTEIVERLIAFANA
ncbi:MAG: hypothetical protein QNJ33_13985 [Crocosphaera sp.]|nr:hypothetical protein [Crocosphaera sp.]